MDDGFPANQIGRAIADRRLALGMNQNQLAWKMGVSPGAVSNWENGRHIPTGEHVIQLGRALKISPDDLGIGPYDAPAPATPLPPPWFEAWWDVEWREQADKTEEQLGVIQKQLLRIESLLTQEVSASAQAEGQHQ